MRPAEESRNMGAKLLYPGASIWVADTTDAKNQDPVVDATQVHLHFSGRHLCTTSSKRKVLHYVQTTTGTNNFFRSELGFGKNKTELASVVTPKTEDHVLYGFKFDGVLVMQMQLNFDLVTRLFKINKKLCAVPGSSVTEPRKSDDLAVSKEAWTSVDLYAEWESVALQYHITSR